MSIKSIIGVLVVIILVVGGYYLMRNMREGNKYVAYFGNVQGLQHSSPVLVKGVRVGKIGDIDLSGERVKVIITMTEDMAIPKGTIAFLASGGLTGDKQIRLDMGPGPETLPDGSQLNTG